jgi:hypothetical protein
VRVSVTGNNQDEQAFTRAAEAAEAAQKAADAQYIVRYGPGVAVDAKLIA